MLIISIAAGIGSYLLYMKAGFLHPAGPVLLGCCKVLQPLLLFLILFLNFCKIEPSQMRPHRWMAYLLVFQGAAFCAVSLLLWWASSSSCGLADFVNSHRICVEAFMLCLICPTAGACAVVTGKLGGNMAGVVTYTVLINLLVSVVVPIFVPLVHPQEGISFWTAFYSILAKVFPLLILPSLLAWLVRYLMPRVHVFLVEHNDWAFYLWTVGLALAILMSVRSIVASNEGFPVIVSIASASLLSCVLQFATGKAIGSRYGCKISAGQALGQKNTVFAIWMGYTFLDPVVSVAGGFYSIWHNCFNSWQLYYRRLELEKTPEGTSIVPE